MICASLPLSSIEISETKPAKPTHKRTNQALVGLALAYPISTFLHVLAMLWVGKRMISFKPSKEVAMMFLVSILFIGASLLIALTIPKTLGLVLGFGVTAASAVYCIRSLSSRLGEDQRLVRLALKLPFGRWMFT